MKTKFNLVIVGLLFANTGYAISKKALLQQMNNVHQRAFGKENLVTDRFGLADDSGWRVFVYISVGQFIDDINGKVFKPIYEKVKAISDSFVTILRDIYEDQGLSDTLRRDVFSQTPESLKSALLIFKLVDRRTKNLNDQLKSLIQIEDELKKKKASGDAVDVKEVLNQLIITLEETIKKVLADIKRIQMQLLEQSRKFNVQGR